MNAAVKAGLVLGALLVGAALPVLARGWAGELADVAARGRGGGASVQSHDRRGLGGGGRLRRELTAFDGGGERVASALGAVDDLGRAAPELRRTVKVAAAIGAAVGPGIAAAVRTMREPGSKDTNKENHHESA